MKHHPAPQTMSSREFNQNTSRAKKAADAGPLVITDRGSPAYVLLRYEDYEALQKRENSAPERGRSLADAINDPRPEADFEFEIPRMEWKLREVDFES